MLRQAISVLLITVSLCMTPAHAGVIAIVIDDLGYNYRKDLEVAQIHPQLTLAVLPTGPYARREVTQFSQQGREIMLHLPMQSVAHGNALEPIVLNLDMSELGFKTWIEAFLRAYPEAVGVNNHMGSLLTQHPGHMAWLMQVLKHHGHLYFIDSRTDKRTVAAELAHEYALPHTQRDVFLDAGSGTIEDVWEQLRRLDHLATRQGFALAIGHPHPLTLQALRQGIPWLVARGHQIVPASQYIRNKEETQCPECLSPSLKVVKSSKPSR